MLLVKDSDPILKQSATRWDFEKDLNAAELEIDLVKTMIDNNGIGLAAPQVGISKRVFAIRLKDQVPFCMFNPCILHGDNDLEEGEEGCLSFPELYLKVKRHKKITAMYLDRQGKQCIIELEGIDSRCFQHELDHLEGITFTEHVSQLKLTLAKKKQQKRNRNGRTK